MTEFQKLHSGLRLAWAAAGLLTCMTADSHPDAMDNRQKTAPGPSSPPPSTQAPGVDQPGSPPVAGPRPLNDCGSPENNIVGPSPIRPLPNTGYTPKISMSTGFVTHLHQDDATALQHLLVKPQGQFAELWYLAEQRWLDQAGTCMRYCVFPRIEVTGDAVWDPANWPNASSRSSPPSPPLRPAPVLTLNIGGIVDTVTLDTPLVPGASFELPHSSKWCKVAPANPTLKVVLSVEGYEKGVTVNFGKSPTQPPKGPASGPSNGKPPIAESR